MKRKEEATSAHLCTKVRGAENDIARLWRVEPSEAWPLYKRQSGNESESRHEEFLRRRSGPLRSHDRERSTRLPAHRPGQPWHPCVAHGSHPRPGGVRLVLPGEPALVPPSQRVLHGRRGAGRGVVQPCGPARPGERRQGRQRRLPAALQRLRTRRLHQAHQERRQREPLAGPGHDLLGRQERVRALGRRRSRAAWSRSRRRTTTPPEWRLEETVFRYCAYTRIRDREGRIRVLPADIAVAMFQHGTSRENDPQLHTHCVIFNAARTHEDGKWRAMHQYPVYSWAKAAGAVYRNALPGTSASASGSVWSSTVPTTGSPVSRACRRTCRSSGRSGGRRSSPRPESWAFRRSATPRAWPASTS